MEKLKIIFLEEKQTEISEQFRADIKDICEWIEKVLNDSPDVKIFTFKTQEDSQFLKDIKENVPKIIIEFVDEQEIPESRKRETNNIICAVLCINGKILGTQITVGTPVPSEYFSSYARARILAEYVNER